MLALWGESLAAVGETISKVREAVALRGRENYIRFSLSLRPIIAPTEDGAWSRTEPILARAKSRRCRVAEFHAPAKGPDERRCAVSLAETAKGSVVDERFWIGIAELTHAAGDSTSLPGTPQQVAHALLKYHKFGVSKFLIRGFDALEDALAYGRDLLPLVRAAVANQSEQARQAVPT